MAFSSIISIGDGRVGVARGGGAAVGAQRAGGAAADRGAVLAAHAALARTLKKWYTSSSSYMATVVLHCAQLTG